MKLPSRRPLRLLGLTLAFGLALPAGSGAQEAPSSGEILARSIAYHDPAGIFDAASFRYRIVGTRPLAGPTFTTIVLDNAGGRFHLERERLGRTVESTVTGDDCWTRLDGSSEYGDAEADRFGLSCEAMRRTRDYHVYLYSLPMKLRDEGTIIDPEATRTTFEGRDAWQVRVTYDPDVGTDTWYFYFDPGSWALVGYRFYHDESANDGEYIVLDREVEGGGLRLPKVRAWYMHEDDRLVGTDTIQAIERLDRNDDDRP